MMLGLTHFEFRHPIKDLAWIEIAEEASLKLKKEGRMKRVGEIEQDVRPRQSILQLLLGKTNAAQRSEIVVYPDAKHAFFADYRPSYDPAAAADGWQRCLGWLRSHGAA